MRAGLIALLSTLALAACNRPAADMPAAPTPPADAPPATPAAAPAPAGPDFSKDINAVGTEPFWGVEIRAHDLTLSGADRPDMVAVHMGAAVQGGAAVWEGRGPGGQAVRVSLVTETCSDGMSDRAYPYRAQVDADGEQLKGCAAPVDAWPK
jgi:uncharacterized membrane protein